MDITTDIKKRKKNTTVQAKMGFLFDEGQNNTWCHFLNRLSKLSCVFNLFDLMFEIRKTKEQF